MSECSILSIEDALLERIKILFKDEKFEKSNGELTQINIFNNFVPIKEYRKRMNEEKKDDEDDDIPMILLRYKSDQQSLNDGIYDSFIEFEMIVGIYEKSSSGHRKALEVVEKIKKEFMEYSNNKNFSIRQDYFKTTFLEEESYRGYWFVKSEFRTHNIIYKSQIPLG